MRKRCGTDAMSADMPGVTHLAREHSTHQNLSEKTNTKTGTGQSDRFLGRCSPKL